METLLVERDAGVVTVTMNRPERKNAATATMLAELRACFEEVERRTDDRVLVLTGAGGSFCSGLDLGGRDADAAAPDPPMVRMRRLARSAGALHAMAKPTIAKVDGVAYGAGLGLALGCDLVVVSDRARLATFFSRRGLSLDTGTSWLLPRLVGVARAKELAMFSDVLDGSQAAEIGLVNRVVPAGELDEFVSEWARRLADGPTLALSLSKAMIDGSGTASFEQALETEAHCQAVSFASADAAEASAAYMDRRDPHFAGR